MIYKRFTICVFFLVRKDIDSNSEDEVKVKEQAVLELGSLMAETKQAEG